MLFAIKRALLNECFNHQLIGHLLIEVMKFGIRVLLVVIITIRLFNLMFSTIRWNIKKTMKVRRYIDQI